MRTINFGGDIIRKMIPITAYPDHNSKRVAEDRN